MPRAAALRIEVLDPARRAGALRRLVKQVAGAVARRAGVHGAVTLLLTDNARLRQLNRDFRKLDRATDVLAFPSGDDAEDGAQGAATGTSLPAGHAVRRSTVGRGSARATQADHVPGQSPDRVLGDIAISLDLVFAQALASGHSKEREFAYLLTHALLHLGGMTHAGADDTHVMRALEERILADLGLTRDPAARAT